MLSGIFSKKTKLVGLDIGSNTIKVAQVIDTKNGYELVYFDTLATPPETIADGTIKSKNNLTSALLELQKKGDLYNANVVVGISGHSSVMIKKIKLPMMTEEELMESIRYEAEQYIPFDINDVNLDFQIIGPHPEEPNQMEVLLVAVKKTVVNDLLECIEKADMDVSIVDVEMLALYNAYEANYDPTEDDYVALIDIGYSKSFMHVVLKDVTIFTRDMTVGLASMVEALSKRFSISAEDAERLLQGRSVDGVDANELTEGIMTATEDIAYSIRMDFDFLRNTVGYITINSIILSGASALINGFVDRLSELLGIQVTAFNPFKKIAISPKLDKSYLEQIAPICAIAVGLALRREDDR